MFSRIKPKKMQAAFAKHMRTIYLQIMRQHIILSF